MSAISDAKKKGKKKSHKKKTTVASAIENADDKSTLFPKPDKKLTSDKLDSISTTTSSGLSISTVSGGWTFSTIAGSSTSVGSTGTGGTILESFNSTLKDTTSTQTSVAQNITITTLQPNTSTANTTEEIHDSAYEDETDNEDSIEDNTINENTFMQDFKLPRIEKSSKNDDEDYEVFVTEPLPEFKRKKRQLRKTNSDSRKKR